MQRLCMSAIRETSPPFRLGVDASYLVLWPCPVPTLDQDAPMHVACTVTVVIRPSLHQGSVSREG